MPLRRAKNRSVTLVETTNKRIHSNRSAEAGDANVRSQWTTTVVCFGKLRSTGGLILCSRIRSSCSNAFLPSGGNLPNYAERFFGTLAELFRGRAKFSFSGNESNRDALRLWRQAFAEASADARALA